MLGLIAHLRHMYIILSYMEAGDGRAYLIFISRCVRQFLIIIELKHCKIKSLFELEAKNAIEQIDAKRVFCNMIIFKQCGVLEFLFTRKICMYLLIKWCTKIENFNRLFR
jgi:hypothetical protein